MSEIVPKNRYQSAFGVPSARTRTKVRATLDQALRAFIEQAPFVVLATADAEGRCDASPKGGRPGFVRVLDDRRLLLPDVRGNRLFQSYENIDANPHVGMIFFIPGVGRTVRVNGRARVVGADALSRQGLAAADVFDPDDDATLLQGLLIEIEEVYPHCPRALTFSRLWDPATIDANRIRSTTEAKRPVAEPGR